MRPFGTKPTRVLLRYRGKIFRGNMVRFVLLLLCVAFAGSLVAQTPIDFYGHTVTPPKNIASLQKGAKNAYAALGRPVEGQYILLAQFKEDPTMSDRLNLKQYGVTVYDNVGTQTYFVAVKSDKIRQCTKKTNMVSLFAVKDEWKLSAMILSDSIPAYALDGTKVGIMVSYLESISEKTIKARLKALGLKQIPKLEGKPYYTFDYWIDRKKIRTLAKEAWVKRIRLVYPPAAAEPAE